MAEKTVNSGIAQFFHMPDAESTANGTDGDFATLENQTDIYFKNITAVPGFGVDEFTAVKPDGSKTKSGLDNETNEKKFDTSSQKYADRISQNGSDILAVDGTQVGNELVAQTQDFKAYDEYIKRGQ